LSWNVEGATSVEISSGVGTVPATGSREVRPTATTTYQLTARNQAGESTATATVTVTGGPGPGPGPAPTLAQCTATPSTSAKPGDPVVLRWVATNAQTVTVSGGVG